MCVRVLVFVFVCIQFIHVYRWACVRAAHTCVKVHKYTSVCVCVCTVAICEYIWFLQVSTMSASGIVTSSLLTSTLLPLMDSSWTKATSSLSARRPGANVMKLFTAVSYDFSK